MKVLFDTNVILSLWQSDKNYVLDCFASLDICQMKNWETCICASQVDDLEYLLHARNIISDDKINKYMEQLFEIFKVIDVAECDCLLTLSAQKAASTKSKKLDFDDGIIAFSAQRHGVDSIVSIDKQFAVAADASGITVSVIQPKDFVACYKPKNIDYDYVESVESFLQQ